MDENARNKAASAEKSGIDGNMFLSAYEAQKNIKGDKDAAGNTVALSASRKKKDAIDAAVGDMAQGQREILYDMFDVSKSVWNTRYLPRGGYTSTTPKVYAPKAPTTYLPRG